MNSLRAVTRRAALAAFLLFAAALFVVGPADASRTTDARSVHAPPSAQTLASSSSRELASLELALLEPIELTDSAAIAPRLSFAENLSLLDVEARSCGFELFGGVGTSRCELTYARNNPLKYVDPDGREVIVAVQEVMAGKYHASVMMVPRQNAAWAGRSPFTNTYPGGLRFATLGAGPEHERPVFPGRLISGENRPRDILLTNKVEYKIVDIGDRDENAVIGALLAADRAYNDDLKYSFFPGTGGDGYNSNSYAAGILKAVGLEPPVLDHNVPGYKKPLPSKAFVKKSATEDDAPAKEDQE